MTVLIVLFLLIVIPAVVAFVSESLLLSRSGIRTVFDIGARVVYQQQEVSNRPIAGARDIRPSARGEFYYYNLVNYLRVTEVLDDGRLIAVASDNKRICFWPHDSQFRKARLIERFSYRWHFPYY